VSAKSAAAPAGSLARQASDRLLRKVDEAVEQIAIARRVAHQAQVREAVTRANLTDAVAEALSLRAAARAELRAVALARYLAQGRPRPLRRRGRPVRWLEETLARLGSPGKALVIAASGVWRGTGRRVFDLRHMAAYVRHGAEPAVAPATLLDQGWYLETNPDVRAARASPLVHYLLAGAREARSPHPLFDAAWYRQENAAELDATSLSPLEHYLRAGAAHGCDPHPLFDIGHYVAQAPDLAAGEDPLSHYLREGWRAGLSPHPLFSPAWYRKRAPRAAREVPPLVHYVTEGWRKGVSPHPLFDPAWYLIQNPDVAEAGREPLAHFVATGAREGRSPSALFDLPHYVAARGRARADGANPLIDYLQGGAWVVAEARPGFPTAAYLAAHPELGRLDQTPLEHWARQLAS
jgi:hypothetical protein